MQIAATVPVVRPAARQHSEECRAAADLIDKTSLQQAADFSAAFFVPLLQHDRQLPRDDPIQK